MAKIAILVLFAIVGVCIAKPFGGVGVAHKTHHVSSQIISPYMSMGLGYGLMGGHHMGMGHHIGMGHHMHKLGMGLGMGLKGLGMGMMYPGGIGMGYGMMG